MTVGRAEVVLEKSIDSINHTTAAGRKRRIVHGDAAITGFSWNL
jgi:hypothetical protein